LCRATAATPDRAIDRDLLRGGGIQPVNREQVESVEARRCGAVAESAKRACPRGSPPAAWYPLTALSVNVASIVVVPPAETGCN